MSGCYKEQISFRTATDSAEGEREEGNDANRQWLPLHDILKNPDCFVCHTDLTEAFRPESQFETGNFVAAELYLIFVLFHAVFN